MRISTHENNTISFNGLPVGEVATLDDGVYFFKIKVPCNPSCMAIDLATGLPTTKHIHGNTLVRLVDAVVNIEGEPK